MLADAALPCILISIQISRLVGLEMQGGMRERPRERASWRMTESNKKYYMTVTTHPESDEPVYKQVAGQIRELIAYGELEAGYRLPSVRSLASDLGVNLNTVARAYKVLEAEGFVVISGRSRARVAPPGSATPEKGRPAPAVLMRALREVLARLRQAGIARDGLLELVEREIEAMPEAAVGSCEANGAV